MMKRFAFLFTLMVSAVLLHAQNGKVSSAYSNMQPEYNKLDKAKEAIDVAILHEKTKASPKAWKVRGQVYQAIANTQDEGFKKLSEDALNISYESFIKALEYDEKGKYKEEINNQLLLLGMDFVNQGITCYNANDFKCAFAGFEKSIKIDEMVDPTKIDTMVIFNAAVAADRADLYDEAIVYYKKATELKYEGAKVFGLIANIEKERGDTAAYISVLEEGIDYYPGNNVVLVFELINHYLSTDQSGPALENLRKGIENEPENASLYFAQGALYDKMGEYDNAKSSYNKAIELKADYYDAYYNLGALIFNKGADMLRAANEIPPNKQKEYENAVKESLVQLAKALPSLEKAFELNSEDQNTMITLKEIYFKLRNDSEDYMSKYKAMNDKIKELEIE